MTELDRENLPLPLEFLEEVVKHINDGLALEDDDKIINPNPHGLTKEDVGLGGRDNTANYTKPVSNALFSEMEKYFVKSAYEQNGTTITSDIATDVMWHEENVGGESKVVLDDGYDLSTLERMPMSMKLASAIKESIVKSTDLEGAANEYNGRMDAMSAFYGEV